MRSFIKEARTQQGIATERTAVMLFIHTLYMLVEVTVSQRHVQRDHQQQCNKHEHTLT